MQNTNSCSALPLLEQKGSANSESVSSSVTRTLAVGDGESHHVPATLWNTLNSGKLDQPSEEEEDDHNSWTYTPSCPQCTNPVSASFLGGPRPPISLVELHPSPDASLRMWKTFVECVDPFAKILHRPTTLAVLQRTASDPKRASPKTVCLLFAIYHFAVSAMDDVRCSQVLGQPKAFLLEMYQHALKQALVSVNFLRSTDRTVLQAYVLFLLSVRSIYDPHVFWMLTGIATRMGQRMSLHRDGAQQGLNPFDVQMNRRLWWQLMALDGIASQLSGTGMVLSPGSWDTDPPLNLNDEDIWPGMQDEPKERNGATDVILVLTRIEIKKLHQIATPSISGTDPILEARDLAIYQDCEECIDELECSLEGKYLRFCDWAEPLHAMVVAIARISISATRLRLRIAKFRQTSNYRDSIGLFKLAMKILDYDVTSHNESILSRYRWQMISFIHWDALMWVLTELRKGSPTGESQDDWGKIDALYRCHPELAIPKRALPIAAGKFCCKAWDDQSASDKARIPEPSFLGPLRATLERRAANRQSSMVTGPSTRTTSETLDITPASLQADDLPSWDPFKNNSQHISSQTVPTIDDIDASGLDWAFLDELIKAPDLFQAAPSR